MKILAIHNYHRKGSASGDDQVFKNETALLEQNNNCVIRYSVCNDEFDSDSPIEKVKSTFGMVWSFKNYRNIQKLIDEEKPEIVHVHTFFPLLSPSILYAAKRKGCKVIATLHDTRFICPCATSLRSNQLCNECGDGYYFRMCKYKCFKNSRLQSFIVACVFKYHRIRRTFYDQIDRYICLNDNQIRLLESIGFDEKKIDKKYNFVPDPSVALPKTLPAGLPDRYVVFYGRIGEEKGIRVLMKIWDKLPEIPLVVMGTGPLEQEFSEWASEHENVHFLGYTQHERCLAIVKNSEFVVFPSIWYEGCSMVEIETESLGKGIIATDLGFSAEAIQNGFNGYKIKLNDVNGFAEKIKKLWNDPDQCLKIGNNARVDYQSKYLPEISYQELCRIYGSV